MVKRATIRTTALSFWTAAGGRGQFGEPVDLERAAISSLPLAVHRVANLTSASIASVLAKLGIDPFEAGVDRAFRGFLMADVGVALILIDSNDPIAEQRMTLAHEIAHFLLHYDAPRRRAIAVFGSRILAVLDRTRPASRSELFSSALRDVPIAPFRHALERTTTGATGQAGVMETEADELALELLAPHDLVRAMNAEVEAISARFGIPEDCVTRLLTYGRTRTTTIGVEALFGIGITRRPLDSSLE
jgi:hypothetical protein